jgi:hypothetical protein
MRWTISMVLSSLIITLDVDFLVLGNKALVMQSYRLVESRREDGKSLPPPGVHPLAAYESNLPRAPANFGR